MPTLPSVCLIARALFLALVLSLGLTTACAPAIGDDCTNDAQCSTGDGEVCDISVEGGYCTVQDCQVNGCPDDAVCITFDQTSSYCMAYCEDDDECRDGQVCRRDIGSEGFCYVPAP